MKLPRPKLFARLRPATLMLDALFAVWMLHVLVTGHLIPTPVANLIHPPSPIAVISEPAGAPHDRDSLVDFRPEA
ncbi:MAG: hypothetical protein GEU75_03785 [Dehalococcoidia bacterium]|nr:hypothetical protein [Dehalococcoidia bacterium]